MLKDSRNLSAILQGLNTKKTKKFEELPTDYVVVKFFELGFYPKHNRYNDTYQCSCPICKEGKSLGKKKRCFYIPENNLIYCHNCGWSSNPLKWIMRVSGMKYGEICSEISDDSYDLLDAMSINETVKIKKTPSLPDDCINLFDHAQLEYYKDNNIVQTALNYLKLRRLDTAINKPSAFYISLNDFNQKNRLVIPFLDTSGKIIHYQTRKLVKWDEKPNYLSKINSDKSIFGIDRINSELDDVFIFEGPLDACFVQNGVAVAGINEGQHRFTSIQLEQLEELKLYNKIWVLDNQWIDKTAKEKTKSLLDIGECVFIWPEKFKTFKDFNELCIHCGLDEIKHKFIKKNSTFGKGAILKFNVLFKNL